MNWDSIFAFPIEMLPFVVLVLLIALAIHEYAHAFTAYKFGDPTPREMGRVTLNPQRHIDIFGLLLFVLAGFGWARPVLINPSNFKRPRLMSAIVALAGPAVNLILSFIGMFLYAMYYVFQWRQGMSTGLADALDIFLQLFYHLNMTLFIFNLIPLPPLDGYRILSSLLPYRVMARIRPYEHWSLFIILLLAFIPPLNQATLGQLFKLQIPILQWFQDICLAILGR